MRYVDEIALLARVKECLAYDGNTGIFTWKVLSGRRKKLGSIAGTKDTNGYVYIGIDGKRYGAHRLAMLLKEGRWPINMVDHIDGNGLNNRPENLRHCNKSENGQNQIGRRGKMLPMGVHPNRTRFMARIKIAGVDHFLGTHDTPEEASEAYLKAKRELHYFQPVPRNLLGEDK